MKQILILTITIWLAVLSQEAKSQHYQMYRPQDEPVYKRVGTSELYAINFDSAFFGGTFDILGYPVKFYDFNYGCDSVGYFGKRIFISYVQGNIFTNKWNKEITILPWKLVGESWKAYDLGGGDSLEGTVISVTLLAASSSDSIKTIRFSAKNALGQAMSHHTNGSEIKISLERGMIQFPDFSNFPYHTDSLELFSRNSASYVANIGFDEVFDFNPGDIFHYREKDTSGYTSNHRYDHHLIKTTIQSQKTPDSVFHTFDRKYHQTFTNPSNVKTTLITHDTVTEKFAKIDFTYLKSSTLEIAIKNPNGSGQGSMKFLSGMGSAYIPDGNLFERKEFGLNFYTNYDSFAQGMICVTLLGAPADLYFHFGRGLGRVKSGQYIFKDTTLVFFKKGLLKGGDSIQWDNLLLGIPESAKGRTPINVYPNPVESEVFISGESTLVLVRMINSQGQIVNAASFKISEGIWKVDMGTLPKGIYILEMRQGKNPTYLRVVK